MDKLFDLHMEIFYDGNLGEYISRVALSDGSEVINRASTMNDVMTSMIFRMKSEGITQLLFEHPEYSVFPAPGSQTTGNTGNPIAVPNKNDPKKLPSDCIGFSHPQCQLFCSSFDCFGKRKCKNMCSWRPEVL